MKTLIYSDVHGNLPAFEAVLKDAGRCDQYICLGDLVNYGPWSNECVELALSLPNSVFLMGNHEEAFIQGSYPGNNPLVKSFFEKCHLGFNRINEIKSLLLPKKRKKLEAITKLRSLTIFDRAIQGEKIQLLYVEEA